MNITLLSLAISSLVSMSPFHVIHQHQGKVSTSIFNSRFSYSFTNILYTRSSYHHTILKNNEFSHSLTSALFLSNDGETQNKLTIIKNKEFAQHKHYNNVSEYGDLTIATCIFKNCNSEYGGAIFIEQDCSVILHESIFDSCSAKDGAGGYICKIKNNRENYEVKDEPLKQVDVQYCCFQKCRTDNNEETRTGFGSALLLSGLKVKLFYASTVNCPGKGEGINQARGAQFDIQSQDVSSENVNATGGYSKFCGSIEYRESNSGFFRFQTIMNMECMFVTSFSKFKDAATIDITYCNLINNKINTDPYEGTYPALIHVRQQDITIRNFAFVGNTFGENGRIASKESQIQGYFPNQVIKLINCYADSYVAKESEAFQTENCNFSKGEQMTLNDISQLNLGDCKGSVSPATLVITDIFTPSIHFSISDDFSNSIGFSKSDDFTHSEEFSQTGDFTYSNEFSKTGDFTHSIEFSKTGDFTYSNEFSKTGDFTHSTEFSKTGDFTYSNEFSKTGDFTHSNEFSKSGYFSQTDGFANTKEFSKSAQFSESSEFTNSKDFSKSDNFEQTNMFSKSGEFSESQPFTASSSFSPTNIFTPSDKFTSSNPFTKSDIFSQTGIFSKSEDFTPIAIIPNESKKENKLTSGAIAGIAVGVAAAAAIIAAAAFFIIKKHKLNEMDQEDIETLDTDQQTTNMENPIYNKKAEDDPFKEDFNN